MADYAAAVLAKAQVILNEQAESAEMREKPSASLMTLLQNRNYLIPNITEVRTREDRPTNVYLKNRTSRSLISARAHDHTGAISDATEVPVTFDTYGDKFATSLKRADDKLYSDAQILAHEIKNAFANIHEGIETAMITWFDTNKNTVSLPTAVKRAPFNAVNDVYEVAAGDSNEYWNIIKSIFRQEKYSASSFDVISDSLLVSTGDYIANQGTGNSANLGFQFAGLDVKESIELADANYANGISFAMPKGMTGIIDWIPLQNRQGKGNFDSYLGGYSTIVDPLTGLSFAMHGYSDRADTTGTEGMTQDEITQWEMTIDLSPQHAPQTTAGATPIFAVGQL